MVDGCSSVCAVVQCINHEQYQYGWNHTNIIRTLIRLLYQISITNHAHFASRWKKIYNVKLDSLLWRNRRHRHSWQLHGACMSHHWHDAILSLSKHLPHAVRSTILNDPPYSLSTLETIVADFGDNLSPKTATVAVLATVAEFGDYSGQCGQRFEACQHCRRFRRICRRKRRLSQKP